MRLIAVDPGKLTGVFAVDSDLNVHPSGWHYERSPIEAARTVRDLVEGRFARVQLVVERFNITPQTAKLSPQLDALEVIGMMRLIAADRPVCTFRLQNRADRKRVSDDMLRRVGWYSSIGNGHSNDAARHALVWLATFHHEHPFVKLALGAA